MGMIISVRVVLTLALLCLGIDGVWADGKDDKDFALNLFSDIAPYGQQAPQLACGIFLTAKYAEFSLCLERTLRSSS